MGAISRVAIIFLIFQTVRYLPYDKYLQMRWLFKKKKAALAGVAQWTVRRPVNQKVTCLGGGPVS